MNIVFVMVATLLIYCYRLLCTAGMLRSGVDTMFTFLLAEFCQSLTVRPVGLTSLSGKNINIITGVD
jgi:hypothetical protein